MSVPFTALVLATVLASPAPPLKCAGAPTISPDGRRMIVSRPVDPKNPVTVVDAVVYPDLESATAGLPREEIEFVEVACFDREAGAFKDGVGLPVVRFITKTLWDDRPDTAEAREAAQASALDRWFREQGTS